MQNGPFLKTRETKTQPKRLFARAPFITSILKKCGEIVTIRKRPVVCIGQVVSLQDLQSQGYRFESPSLTADFTTGGISFVV